MGVELEGRGLYTPMEFRDWLESSNGSDDLEVFYRDNESRVLADPEVRKQLNAFFQAKDATIRKVLGVGSEDPRGNYFVRTFNQRHGDWERSLRVPFRVKYPEPEKKEEPPIPEEILKWFGGSKIVNRDGTPKVVYHGTSEKFDRFEAGEFGFHFGDKEAGLLHAGIHGPDRYLIRITNPLRMKDMGIWHPNSVLEEILQVLQITRHQARRALRDTDRIGDRLASVLDQDDDFIGNRRAFYRWSKPARDFIKSLGYDGIVYRNEAEGFNDSYIAFDHDQIRRLP